MARMICRFRIRRTLVVAAAALAGFAGAACSSDDTDAPALAAAPQEATLTETAGDDGVANLPFARGQVFYSLDDYLAHLEKQGAIDLPWWREISPGVYEHVVRMPEAKREIATRERIDATLRLQAVTSQVG